MQNKAHFVEMLKEGKNAYLLEITFAKKLMQPMNHDDHVHGSLVIINHGTYMVHWL